MKPPPGNRYGRIPESVLLDPELTPTDIRVYGVLSLRVFDGNIACIGQRLIAKAAILDRRTVRRSLANLARQGHISVSVVHLKRRCVYQLNSSVFGSSEAPEIDKQLGGDMRPDLGVVARPRIRHRRGRVVTFDPKRQPA